ncbi:MULTISPECIES: hypothetical protein [unclassified Curtobacterium]|uniref:hypothetical protein n=1 Tax=unclassified Curtobacterium TaxID=257496 RepID=UPI001048D98D|nr:MULTISPECIES: hypothetical protein [unclassified Curtobacterium]
MTETASHVRIIRDVPAGGSRGVWRLDLISETGAVVDVVSLPTEDRDTDPLAEATEALRVRQYDVGDWVQPSEEHWNAQVERFGLKDTLVVHFQDENLHLSGTVESYGTPRFIELDVEGQKYPEFWKIEDTRESGSADAHYRPYTGLETDGDVPVCTNAS